MRNNKILKGRSILLAEDDALQAVDLFDTLSDEGARAVVSVSELDKAMRIVERHSFDAAILDYRLGKSLVTPLADYLNRTGTPFIIHTGYAHADAFPNHWRGCQLISKPSAPEKLVHTLAALIRWKRMSKEPADAAHLV